jgi:hypothetical protein
LLSVSEFVKPEKEQENTKSDVFLYSGFAPLIQVASLATSQLEHLAAPATTTTGTVRDGAGSESRVRKTCDQDGFYPVVEVAHPNNRRDAPLIDANIRPRII